MLLNVRRDLFSGEWTLGLLAIVYDCGWAYTTKGWITSTDTTPKPFGYSCEDQDRGLVSSMSLSEIRRIKVMSETAIPTGEYATRIRWRGAPHNTDVIELLDVPGYAGILIHPGNRERDTAGCLLPGLRRLPGSGEVVQSTDAVRWLLARAKECRDRGEPFRVRVERDPGAWACAPLNSARTGCPPGHDCPACVYP